MFCEVIDYAKLYIKDVSHKYADAHIADKYRWCKKKAYAEQYSAERKTRLSRPTLSRAKKDEVRDKKQDYIDEAKRVEVERKFSLAKRKCRIELTLTRLKETTCHCLAMSVLLLNLRKIERFFLQFFIMVSKTAKNL